MNIFLEKALDFLSNISADKGNFINDSSIVLKIEYHGQKVLLTGGIEEKGWEAVMENLMDQTIDILKLPHHGSDQIEYAIRHIQQLDPSFIYISVDDLESKKYGHPNAKMLKSLLPMTKIQGTVQKPEYYSLYRTDDFKHDGEYNDLNKFRISSTVPNDLISYIFGIVPPKNGGFPLINTYRLYQANPNRKDSGLFAFDGKSKPLKYSQFNLDP